MKFAIVHYLALILSLLTIRLAGGGCRENSVQAEYLSRQTEKTLPAASRMHLYLKYLKGKRIAVFANPTSMVGRKHLVDTLKDRDIDIRKIFSPEHGFRGTADAGEKVSSGKDARTGIPVISLYGDHKKPTPADLEDIDIIVFDIQDVGARFYTYISSLEYVMEAALENDKQLIILDRPNPNGWYIDGPVLDRKFRSFVGMQPVPVVYGMTIGEYALMVAGEGWMGSEKANHIYKKSCKEGKEKVRVTVIPCGGYDHLIKYSLPEKPSPNLREMQSVYWYPSICLFEGTILSEGRGTDKPFQIFGHPLLPSGLFSFTPKPNAGAKSSKCYNQICYGWNLSGSVDEVLKKVNGKVQIKYLMEAYQLFPGKDSFFIEENFIQKSGNDLLIRQIREGVTEEQIRKSWEPQLAVFRKIRKKYLLYKDFY